MKLEVGMYVRGKYYSYKGKIGKIIKNHNGDLEIAYQDSIVKTKVSSFIDDNFDINGKQYVASHNIKELIQENDYVNGNKVININGTLYVKNEGALEDIVIKSIVTKEQFESMSYKVGD